MAEPNGGIGSCFVAEGAPAILLFAVDDGNGWSSRRRRHSVASAMLPGRVWEYARDILSLDTQCRWQRFLEARQVVSNRRSEAGGLFPRNLAAFSSLTSRSSTDVRADLICSTWRIGMHLLTQCSVYNTLFDT